jgi:hypothetical protein
MKQTTKTTVRVGCILLALFLLCDFALMIQPVQAIDTVTTIPVEVYLLVWLLRPTETAFT